MNFADLISQLKDRLKSLWAQFEESSTYQQLMDKYEDMSPRRQKMVQVGSGVGFIIILLLIPLSNIFTSNDAVTEFEEKRDLTRELLRTFRDANQAPNIPQAPDLASLQSRIQAELQSLRLNPDQIKAIQETQSNSQLVPNEFSTGALEVSLLNLNTRQIVDVSYQLANLHSSVKLTDLTIEASQQMPGYFSFFAKIISLKAPQVSMPQAEPEPPQRGKKTRRTENSEDEPPPPSDEEE
jgi:hypothetical protein